jgi:nucleoside-diphosphate-sugar epimerase
VFAIPTTTPLAGEHWGGRLRPAGSSKLDATHPAREEQIVTRILVTGGSGFIGAPVLSALVAGEHEVHAISTQPRPDAIAGVRWWRLDLSAGEAVDELLEELRAEQLVHLAWYVEHGRFWNATENVVWVERSLRLLRAFTRAGGRRAVMLGTCAEYDWRHADRPLDELESPIAPETLYGTAKDSLHRVADAFAQRAEIELAWARLFFLYGPREPAARLVPSVIGSLLAGDVAQTTSGAQRRDFLHVEDVAGALAALLESSVIGPVNVASGRPVAVSEIVDLIAEEIGRPELVQRGALAERAAEPALLVANVRRLVEEVGYEARWTLQEGIADAVRWWREQQPRHGDNR